MAAGSVTTLCGGGNRIRGAADFTSNGKSIELHFYSTNKPIS